MKTSINLIICFTIAVVCMATIYAISPLKNPIYRGNFTRTFANRIPLKADTLISLGLNSYYFSGANDSIIYLSNYTNPTRIIEFNTKQYSLHRQKIKMIDIDSISIPRKFRCSVEGNLFYLFNGPLSQIFRGSTHDWQAKKLLYESSHYFMDAVPLSANSFGVTAISKARGERDLAIISLNGTAQIDFKFDILNKQVDGVFDTQGFLVKDNKNENIIYLYAYRNQFIIMNQKFEILRKGTTIDTFRIAQLKVSETDKNGSKMIAAPSAATNLFCTVADGKLYVLSNLMSYKELEANFIKSCVIDVYDISTTKYTYSFYLPRYDTKKVRMIKVIRNQIFALYETNIAIYKINALHQ